MYRKILVPVDGSQTSNRGLMEAIKLAKVCCAQLRLIHVINELIAIPPEAAGALDFMIIARETGEAILKQAQGEAQRHGLDTQAKLVESMGARASEAIVKHAEDWGADLIVMGTHGRRGLTRLVLGSDADYIVRTASLPVLLLGRARTPEK